ncbi:MAG: undecaprenyl-phosphate glucose phosphotransferase [Gammaproteobacteria bacterium]|nr:undecaprenyl-phosphate glucose phosphotransferase [Gammaproteobacteria bacterium]
MPPGGLNSERSLLQRRKSLTTTLQAMIDGLIVLGTVYYAFYNAQGFLSTLDAVFIITLLAIMGVTYDQMGIYRQFGGLIRSARKLFFAWSVSFAITLLIFIMAQYFDQFSRPVLSAIFMIAFAGQLANRWLLITFRMQTALANEDRNNVLLVGGGPLVKHLFDNINGNPWLQEKAIGRIRTCAENDDVEMPVPVLGNRDDIIGVVRDNNVRTVYIAVALENSQLVEQLYLELANENIDIHWVPNIFTLDLINHSVKEMAGLPLLTLSESPLIGNHLLFKAVEDKILGIFALILLSPLMLIISVMIKLDSPGPVFFRQSRTGWNGKEFHIWKFRSMKMHQAENDEVKQATKDDDRITRIGRFIRKTSIDELPQLFNVLGGKMSMVGPRPHAIEHNTDYDKRIRAYMTRHRIKPGITGLAQINGYRGETDTLDKMKKRVEFDMQYINNWSFWLDLEILLKTIPALLRGEAY